MRAHRRALRLVSPPDTSQEFQVMAHRAVAGEVRGGWGGEAAHSGTASPADTPDLEEGCLRSRPPAEARLLRPKRTHM